MIDDDLDRLLSDIDEQNEYSSSREATREFQQKQARRHDNVVTTEEDGADQKESFLKRIERIDYGNAFEFHDKGIAGAIRYHIDQCNRFKDALTYFDAPEGLQSVLRKYNYTFVRYLENIERHFDKYVIELNKNNLRKKAQKDFPLMFEGYEEANKINFLLLKEFFVHLRNYNSLVKREWIELGKSIGVINFADGGKALFQQLDNVVAESTGYCKQTDIFLHAVAAILSLPEDDFDILERDMNNRLIYHDYFDYSLENLYSFVPEVREIIHKQGQIDEYRKEREQAQDSEKYEEKMPQPMGSQDEHQYNADADVEEDFSEPGLETYSQPSIVNFTVKGTRHWNTREPYVIHLDQEKLGDDYRQMKDAFYFTMSPISDDALKGEIRRNLVKYKSGSDADVLSGYEEFLSRKITSLFNDIMDEFTISKDNQNLFFYHLGPATVYNILLAEFKNNGYGSCFKYEEGNRIKRFLPAEFIKENVLRWFENNINSLDLQFDSINNFDSMRKMVTKKYYAEIDQFNKRVDEVIRRMDPGAQKKIDRKKFIKQKAPLRFSLMQMIIYNRFVEKTAFK
ncbi:MAG: hypothetical protein ACOCX9_01070 [Spirochaetota bacterium]